MRRFALPFLVLLLGCGSDYTEDGTSSSSGSSSSSSGSSSSTSSSGSTPSNGLESKPGKIECGKEVCDLATSHCCADGPSDLKCQKKEESCGKNTALCDESADCPEGKKKCCGSASFTGKSRTECTDKCDSITSAQACRTKAECGSQDCIKQSCTGFTSFLCGLNPFCQRL